LTAYGSQELQPELLIGYATQQFHRARELTFRDGMWVGAASAEQPDLRIRPLPSLGSVAIQRITIQPHFLGGEELSRIWSALQARYRPSVSYRVVLELHPEQAGVTASHHDQHRRHN
jgi:hypothetical protein